MMFLLGRHAMLWHEPPMYLRSIRATRFPCSAVVHAATFAPVPLPSTTRSNSSNFGACVEGTLFVVIRYFSFREISEYLLIRDNPEIYQPLVAEDRLLMKFDL